MCIYLEGSLLQAKNTGMSKVLAILIMKRLEAARNRSEIYLPCRCPCENSGEPFSYQRRMHPSDCISMMLSADNGHAMHPNHTDKADPTNAPCLNGGVLIKYNANQKYTTDGIAEALFKRILQKAEIPYQEYTNRSDIAGGSTLGNLSNEKISLNTVDMGAAQLAMHSAYETGGTKDTVSLMEGIHAFMKADSKWRKMENIVAKDVAITYGFC